MSGRTRPNQNGNLLAIVGNGLHEFVEGRINIGRDAVGYGRLFNGIGLDLNDDVTFLQLTSAAKS